MAATYSSYSKLGRIQLPGNPATTYALIDVDGRAVIAPKFSAESSYNAGDYVFYNDELWRAKADIAAGDWSSTSWDQVTVGEEIKRLEGIMAGGIHYRGKTTTALYDGSTTNPISINGQSYTAESGDLVIFDLKISTATAYAADTAYSVGKYITHDDSGTINTYLVTSAITAAENTSWAAISSKIVLIGVNPIKVYAVSTAYAVNTYIKNSGVYYIVEEAITVEENTSFNAIEPKLSVVTSDPEFLFDGTSWSALGSIDDGLGALAWKDSASGTYTKPTGSGSVTIKNYSETSKWLERTTVTGTDGTMNASEVTGGSTKNQWKQDSTNPTINYGTADVDTAVTYGTANPDTPVSGIAKVGSQKTFNTDGIKVSGVQDDMLILIAAGTDNVIGIEDTTGVTITPAIASNTTLTPAKACDSTRTAVNLVSDGTLTGSYTITARTPAKVAASATTVATGGTTDSADGAVVLTALSGGTETATVTVGTATDTVTVR